MSSEERDRKESSSFELFEGKQPCSIWMDQNAEGSVDPPEATSRLCIAEHGPHTKNQDDSSGCG